MPEVESESSVEKINEAIHEAAAEAKESWLKWSALLSVLFAVMAAIAGLQAGFYANEAMIEQIRASDQWSYYQAKGIKSMLVETEQSILQELDKPMPAAIEKIKKYKEEQQEIKEKGEHLAEASKMHLEKHEVMARAVTVFQIAISIVGIAVLTKRRRFVLASLVMGGIGVFFYIEGFLIG